MKPNEGDKVRVKVTEFPKDPTVLRLEEEPS